METEIKYDSLYFVGAGGIGMAALERYFLAKGCKVAGYDRKSRAAQSWGMQCVARGSRGEAWP